MSDESTAEAEPTIADTRNAWVAKEITILQAIKQIREIEPDSNLRDTIQYLWDGVTPPNGSAKE